MKKKKLKELNIFFMDETALFSNHILPVTIPVILFLIAKKNYYYLHFSGYAFYV